MKKYKIYFDGNKSPAGVSCSYLIIDEKDKKSEEATIMLSSETTVPEAEYNGLIKALEKLTTNLLEHKVELKEVEIEIYGDSQLVVNQILGKYECKKPQLRILRSQARTLLERFKFWKIQWVEREKNLVK